MADQLQPLKKPGVKVPKFAGVPLSFWLSLPIVFGISIALYHWVVRDRFIGNLLAGKL